VKLTRIQVLSYMSESGGCIPKKTVTIAHSYNPKRNKGNKKIRVEKGQDVLILRSSENGWTKGKIGDREGWFPSRCLTQVDKHRLLIPPTTNGKKKKKGDKRSSERRNSERGRERTLSIVHDEEGDLLGAAIVLFNFDPPNPKGKLKVKKGDIVDVIRLGRKGWIECVIPDSQE